MGRRLVVLPEAPRRGVALVRVSKAKGRDDLISPELQRTAIADYAVRQGIDVVEWVEALDESASRARSPWWRRLEAAVGAVEAGDRDVVLVWKVSRAARHRRNWAVALDRIEVAGGTLESATEGLDATTSTGRLARGMLAELAAWESEVKGEQWKETHARRRSQGLPHAGGQRLGFSYTKEAGYTVDPELAPVVVELYRRYLSGLGYRQLVEWLGAQGITSPRHADRKPWTTRGIAYYLDCGIAAGKLYVGGEHLAGAHPAIITEATWEAYLRERRHRAGLSPRTVAATTVLAGMVRCASCGYGMRSKKDQRYGPGYLYVCQTQGCTAPVTVTRSRAEQAVLDWLEPYARDVEVAAERTSASKADRALARGEAARLSREIARLTEQLTRLTVLLAAERIGEEEYSAARSELLTDRDTAAAELQRAQDRAAGPALPAPGPIVHLLDEWETLPVLARRQMLRPLVCAVVATKRPGQRPTLQVVPAWEQLP
jgi:DNA invertase Pin-like site-specific DNA recombinase